MDGANRDYLRRPSVESAFQGSTLVLGQKGEANGRKREEGGRYKFVSSRDELRLRQHFSPLAPMLVVVSRENITTMAAAAAHKFVTAVLQMASSIFPARPFLLPPSSSARRASSMEERDGSEARPCRFGGEGQKLALQGSLEFEIASILYS